MYICATGRALGTMVKVVHCCLSNPSFRYQYYIVKRCVGGRAVAHEIIQMKEYYYIREVCENLFKALALSSIRILHKRYIWN